MDLVAGKWWRILLTDFTSKMTQQQVHPLTVSEEGSHLELTVGSLRASGFIMEEKATLVFYIRFQPSPLKLSSFCTFVYTHTSSMSLLCAILLAYTPSPLLPDSPTSVKATKQFCNTTHTHTHTHIKTNLHGFQKRKEEDENILYCSVSSKITSILSSNISCKKI